MALAYVHALCLHEPIKHGFLIYTIKEFLAILKHVQNSYCILTVHELHSGFIFFFSAGMMAAFIGGSIGGLFFFILFLWCCCSVCCKDHEVDSTRNKQWEWNKPEIQLHKISTT